MKKDCKYQDLRNEDFSNVNIKGINFRHANLTHANFRNAKAGISLAWLILLVACLFCLAILTSWILSYAASVAVVPFENKLIYLVFEAFLPFGTALVLLAIILFRGLGFTLAIWGLAIVIIVILIASIAQFELGSILADIVGQVIMRSIGLFGTIAGIATGSLVFASGLTIGNQWLLIPLGLVALLTSIFGIEEGIGSVVNPIDWPLAVSLTLINFALVIYISFQAVKGNPKFRIVQTFAIGFATLKGTRFNGANLTDADFTNANLKNTDFRSADLTRTRWFQTKFLQQARTRGTYLENPVIRDLVVTGQGQNQNFDYQNLRGLNLQGAKLSDASFIGADLSNADLQDADLSRAKLAKAQLYNARLNRACLTGANIQDWAISLDTQFEQVQCDYVYMHLPTPENQDPYRKPDNRDEIFAPGDFADFITPIIKTLALYQEQNVDPRKAATTYKTVDLFHHEGIDPSAAAVALQRLAEQHPEAGLEVVALEGRGNERVRLQARVSDQANPSELSKEYFEQYREIKDLAYGDLQALLRGIEEKDNRIRSLESMVTTAIQQKTFYVETYQQVGDTVSEKNSIEISAGGDIGSLSGITSGDVSGVVNIGTISGNVTNTIGQLPEDSAEKAELKALLQQLQAAIEAEPELEPEDKAEALEQVKTLAEAGQKPEDGAMKKAAKTAVKILKGTTAGLAETTKLVQECVKLLPAISTLLLLV